MAGVWPQANGESCSGFRTPALSLAKPNHRAGPTSETLNMSGHWEAAVPAHQAAVAMKAVSRLLIQVRL